MARALGRTLEELADSMSAQEYGLWMSAYADEPWGEERMDIGFGVVASTLANVNRGKDTPAFKVADFTPILSRHQPPPEEDDVTPLQFIKRFDRG